MSKLLTVYYSHTGTTKKLAEQIRGKLGGDIFELVPADAYPQDMGEVIKRGMQEITDGVSVALQGEPPDAGGYGIIAAGTPNWCSTLAPPLTTYLKSQDLSGKTLAVFVTHGRGGLGHIPEDLQKLFPDAKLAEVFDGNSPDGLDAWLNGLGTA
jgi:flavodoxin